MSAIEERWRRAPPPQIDRRDIGTTPGPGGAKPVHKVPATIHTFPELKPRVPIFITERDISDMDRREDSIELMEQILEAQVAAEQQAKQQAAINAARVRSSPVPIQGAGLLPQTTRGDTMTTHQEGFFDRLGNVAIDYASSQFLGTGTVPTGNGTVVEFPTTFVPQLGTDNGLVYKKKRRRRRRLLTASDKCDIAAMKAMLTSAEFKIWLACPSMFKG